jgi:hypothetical protein
MEHDIFFFGVCAGTSAGHYFFSPGGRGHAAHASPETLRATLPPTLLRVDGVWTAPTPRTPEQVRDRTPAESERETQGEAYIHYVEGWTVLAWWDRSADRRWGCNANLLARGRHRFDAMLALGRQHFPREMARMEAAYRIALAGGDLPESSADDEAAARPLLLQALRAGPGAA